MSNKNPLAVIILAAGKGTRMKSDKPKVMHEILGLPMINWVINSAQKLSPEKIIVVIGQDMEDLKAAVNPYQTVTQITQNGTGSALKCAMGELKDFKGDIVVLLGDTPLISANTIKELIAARHNNEQQTGIAVLGVKLNNPSGYGRLLMENDGILKTIREEKDASEGEKKINIVNSGVFCLDGTKVNNWLDKLDNNNAQSEYYITDLPEIAARENIKTCVSITNNTAEIKGCNTRLDLNELEQLAQKQMREELITNGVTMQDPSSVYLHHDTQIATGTFIEPNVYFGKKVKVEKNVHIKAFCHFEDALIGENTTIGPFARLRPGAKIGNNVRIGNFVEIKKSEIGDRSKINHLGYVGDCIMGKDVNFSCGAITVNYDGFDKHKTIIGDNVMIGSNVNLIAPINIDDGAFIAAGTTTSINVPDNALSVGRIKSKIIEGWAASYREKKQHKD